MRLGEVGLQRDNLAIGDFGIAGTSHLVHQDGKAKPGIEIIRLQRQCTAIADFGVVTLTGGAQHLAEIGMVMRLIAPQLDGAADEVDRDGMLAPLVRRQAKKLSRIGLTRLAGQNLTIERLGLDKLPALMQAKRLPQHLADRRQSAFSDFRRSSFLPVHILVTVLAVLAVRQ